MKKMDEMDRNIRLRSEEYGFKFVILILAGWTLYESYLTLSSGQRYQIFPSMILFSTLAVQGFSEMILKRKMTAGDEEYREPNKILSTIILIIAISAVILCAGTYLLIKIR